MEKLSAKTIVKNTIKLVITEVLYGMILSIIKIGKSVLNTVVAQNAASSEISRLKGETPLPLVEALMNYNNSLSLLGNGMMIIIIILMGYAIYKYVTKTYIGNNEAEDASNKK